MDTFKDFQKWAQRPDTKAKEATPQTNAWGAFTKQFPNADKAQFMAQINIDEQCNITAEMFFKDGKGSLQSVFGSERHYWSQKMKSALGLASAAGFPYQLLSMKTTKGLPIPPVNFEETSASLGKIFDQPINIYMTPDLFMTKFREIFQPTTVTHSMGAEAKQWLGGPHMRYWAQQLNFAMFCATQGCGISQEIFDSSMTLLLQIGAFYKFNVYFTVRRILFQLGGIKSVHALPGDPTFNTSNSHYVMASYKKICDEFRIDPSSNFRFTHRASHRLGYIYFYVSGRGMKTKNTYPGYYKFSDEGGKGLNGNLIYYIESEGVPQYDWFAPNTGTGLTQAGLSCINQSIKAYVYCILGSQVNLRTSILCQGGRQKKSRESFWRWWKKRSHRPTLP